MGGVWIENCDGPYERSMLAIVGARRGAVMKMKHETPTTATTESN